MTVSDDLFLAILSMDSYNRGYDGGIGGISDTTGTRIGNATVSAATSSENDSPQVDAGFYAIA